MRNDERSGERNTRKEYAGEEKRDKRSHSGERGRSGGIKREAGGRGQGTEGFNCNKSTVSVILDGEV